MKDIACTKKKTNNEKQHDWEAKLYIILPVVAGSLSCSIGIWQFFLIIIYISFFI
jgi:hypothetical protein